MEIHRYLLLRGSLVALLIAGCFWFCAYAQEEITRPKQSSESSQTGSTLAEEAALPMRGVLNTFSNAVNDWYTAAYPQLQRFYNANFNYLPYGGSTFKLPGFSGGPQYPIPSQAPVAILPTAGPFSSGSVFQFPPFAPHRTNTTNADAGKGSAENADAQAALVTALNAFHQYVDNFINNLAARLSPYMVHYTPAGFFPFIPSPVPIPVSPVAPRNPDYTLPYPLSPGCLPGDDQCIRVPLDSSVQTPMSSPPPAPEVDMTAIIELLSRFGGKLSSNHIVTLQPFMEQYVDKLSAKSKATLRPLLFQYWPQLFPSADEDATQPAAPLQPAKPLRREEPRKAN